MLLPSNNTTITTTSNKKTPLLVAPLFASRACCGIARPRTSMLRARSSLKQYVSNRRLVSIVSVPSHKVCDAQISNPTFS